MNVLFLLIRDDLESMTLGRSCAMASHITDHFRKDAEDSNNVDYCNSVKAWRQETSQGFGTVYVMGVAENQLRSVQSCDRFQQPTCAVTTDPEYHIEDGLVVHIIQLDVGAYIFGDKDKIMNILGTYGIDYL